MGTHFTFTLSSEQYFHQDTARGKEASSLGTVYNFPKSFGLKDGDWKGFDRILNERNAENPESIRYVVIYLARHGQGYHNVIEEYLGADIWKEPSPLSPEKAVHEFFPDTRLTPIGQHQANTLSATFAKFLKDETNPLPWPQAFYSSPLHRALETGYRTWAPLSSNLGHKSTEEAKQHNRVYDPIVLENLREQMYVQRCNQRSAKSQMNDFTFVFPAELSNIGSAKRISLRARPDCIIGADSEHDSQGAQTKRFTHVFAIHSPKADSDHNIIDNGSDNTDPIKGLASKTYQPEVFSEEDNLYTYRSNNLKVDESDTQAAHRAYQALSTIAEHVFTPSSRKVSADDDEASTEHEQQKEPQQIKYISITTHAGLMSGIYGVLGMPMDQVPRFPTGIVVPLVIRIEKVTEANNNHDDTHPAAVAASASSFSSSVVANPVNKSKVMPSEHTADTTLVVSPQERNGIMLESRAENESENENGNENKKKMQTLAEPKVDEETERRRMVRCEEASLALHGKDLDEVLREIRDDATYFRMIEKVETLRKMDTSKIWDEDALQWIYGVDLSTLEKRIIRALI